MAYLCGQGPPRREASELLAVKLVQLGGEHLELEQAEAEHLNVITRVLQQGLGNAGEEAADISRLGLVLKGILRIVVLVAIDQHLSVV